MAHPVGIAVISALAVGGYAYAIVEDWRAVVAGAAAMFVLVWLVWRVGGLGRRHEERLFDPSAEWERAKQRFRNEE